jgi:PAS domain S-box-containing protein
LINIVYIESNQADQRKFKIFLEQSNLSAKLHLFSDWASGEEALRKSKFDLVFCELDPNSQATHTFLDKKNLIEELSVIVLGTDTHFQTVLDIMKKGAFDYQIKENLTSISLEESVNSAMREAKENRLRKNLEKRLDGIYANTRTILDNTSDGIWSLDDHGRLLIMNSVAKDNLKEHGGRTPAIGEPFFDNINPLFIEIWQPIFQRALSGQEVITIDKYKDGDHEFYLELACTPIVSNKENVGVSFIARNVTEREQAEAKVRESEKNFRSVFTGSQVPILLTAMIDNSIVDLNDACAKLYGYNPKEMIGKDLYEIIPTDNQNQFKQDLDKYLHGKVDLLDTYIKPFKGKSIPVQATVTEIYYNQKPCYLIFLNDISKRIETENILKKARESAEKSAEFKSLFLANMSHEIRTPMNAMLGFADLLKKTTLSEEQNEFVEIISNSGQDLLVIINDILDLTKIEAGKLELRPRNFPLEKIFKKVMRLHGNKAEEKGVELKMEILTSLPDEVFMDDLRITQILNNLLSNAIKFTEKGTVCLRIDQTALDKVDYLQITVVDSGIGIPEGELKTIFENFNQVDSSMQRKYRGTGLGLAIVSQLCSLMKGEIIARSEEGKGSEFELMLPLDESQIQKVEDPNSDKKAILSNELFVLLCEDNPVNVKLASKILQEMGIKYQVASNGKEGVEQTKKCKPNVIFMDLQMPVMDGYEATIEIRKFSKIPIIAMSAHVLEEEQKKCIEVGMNGFIPKPFKAQDIIVELQNQFSFSAISNENELDDKWKRLGMPGLTNMAKGDLEFAISLFDIFMDQAAKDLESFKVSLNDNDKDQQEKIAHRLLPSFMIFEFVQLHIIAEKIENKKASTEERLYFADKLQNAIDEIKEKRILLSKSD